MNKINLCTNFNLWQVKENLISFFIYCFVLLKKKKKKGSKLKQNLFGMEARFRH